MQNADVYLKLLRERGTRRLPVQRVYRQLCNPQFYRQAYGKIARNAGALTPGVTAETADGMSLAKIDDIIQALRLERFQWQPARRTYIPKKNGQRRPLGMPTWSDKLVAEVLRLILEAYFEPGFSEHSHGFRPQRGCHTALQEIYHHWPGTVWYIEGDISACFENLPHEGILATLQEHFQDGRFINLIRELLAAGYLEDWSFNKTLSGVPQGSIVSPILANILLDKLDKYVENVLIPQHTRGKTRRVNPQYQQLMRRAQHLFRQKQTATAQKIRRQAQHLPSVDPRDPMFRRLRYCRYADDFLLGFIGPKAEAEEIKQQIGQFLQQELKLELSKSKTLLTHARSAAAHFLGYEISTLQENNRRCVGTRYPTKRRNINGRIGLQVPQATIDEKCRRYKRKNKPTHRPELQNESDYTILTSYQMEYRGVANYYRLAYNLHTLNRLKWVMERSLTKTLANKHRISVAKVYKRYRAELVDQGTRYKVLQVRVEREGMKPLIATWGGITLKWNISASLQDQPARLWSRQSELEQRLLAQSCELCGATRATDRIEVHHIRALKDLNKYPGREKPGWVKQMAARRRKTLVLCRTCHMAVQYGRPRARQTSSSRM